MRDVKIKKYQKKYDYSFAHGVYPTIELLKVKPGIINKVLLHPQARKGDEYTQIMYLCKKNKIRFEINQRLIEKISFKENTYAVTVFEKYDEHISNDKPHIMLVNPSDMGNVGTIIRSMVAFAHYNLALIRPAVDIFDPRVVRSSMGSIIRIKFEYFSGLNEYKAKYPSHHLYPFMLDGASPLEKTSFQLPYTLVFGNEGEGLQSGFKKEGMSVFIRQSKDIDSLNLSVAVSIAMQKIFEKNATF